jgi:hypothetical protein
VSSEPQTKITRPWRVIAEELSREPDPQKTVALSKELNQALDEQQKDQSEPKTAS